MRGARNSRSGGSPGEKHGFNYGEILEQEVAHRLGAQTRYALAYAELNGGHDFRGGFLYAAKAEK